jgi:hypothetical protein
MSCGVPWKRATGTRLSTQALQLVTDLASSHPSITVACTPSLRAISAALRDETHAIELMLLTEPPDNRYVEPGARLAGQESERADARCCASV